ncbi:hypothetical protein [Paracoccus litorisediminis]|jgi:hypothetical protein|uniref:Uncharacterized protein n=1 Tax=Paracoccus litorisediminis TaxID=2006130 RepID=A0A844HY38_9RHOB|nr:hypothetical protein [Paracoccus litorisediminis]MTH62391.1 hypothetical protein [Paracoccus litorisediminis]
MSDGQVRADREQFRLGAQLKVELAAVMNDRKVRIAAISSRISLRGV